MRKDKSAVMALVINRMIHILLIISIFLMLAACNRSPKEALYQCKDGTMVNDFNLCPEMQEPAEENENISVEETEEPTLSNATVPEPPSSVIKRNVYKNQEEEAKTGSYPSLNGWSVSEIVNGMANYNPNLLGKYPSEVIYDRYRVGSYTVGGKKVEDPFYIIRRHTSGSSREYSYSQLRIELPVRPLKVLDEVTAKHNDSKFKIIYPEEAAEWAKIQCEQLESCRDIEAIKCVNELGDEMYMWAHSTPGEGYTEQIKYTMQAVNDKREMLDTFEKFYCTPR